MSDALLDVFVIGYEFHHLAHVGLVVANEAVIDRPLTVFLCALLYKFSQVDKRDVSNSLSVLAVGTTSINTWKPDSLIFGNGHYSPYLQFISNIDCLNSC